MIDFICLKKISNHPKWIYFTPSIQFANDKDSLGQTYQTSDSAIKAGWSSYVFNLSS